MVEETTSNKVIIVYWDPEAKSLWYWELVSVTPLLTFLKWLVLKFLLTNMHDTYAYLPENSVFSNLRLVENLTDYGL